MRIVSWNIRRRSEALHFALKELGADVLLAQEGKRVEAPDLNVIGQNINERWVKHSWGNFIYSRSQISRFDFPTEYLGSLNIASIESPFGRLGLINVYGLFERVAQGSKKKLATAGLHRKLSDLSPIFWNRLEHEFDHFLLAGDLNHDRRMDTHKNFRRTGTEVYSGLFKRIEDFGMVDLVHRDFPNGVQTYRSVRGSFPWQLDHFFVSERLADSCISQVLESHEIRKLSDHNPIVVDLV